MPNPLTITTFSKELEATARGIAVRWELEFEPEKSTGLNLVLDSQKLALQDLDDKKMGAVYVDFASDSANYRRKAGSIKNEAVAKALGLKGNEPCKIVDATAGLGRDAFVLASLGAKVTMLERNPMVAALLEDGLNRALQEPTLSHWLHDRLILKHGAGATLLQTWDDEKPDAIYLDPMFPHKKKSALVKKEMRLFQALLGPDDDADLLLKPALSLAKKRVVVKRPDYAPFLAGIEPSMQIKSKKHRFDVYLAPLDT